ncbi:MAG: RCC1 domain-containing protein [Candidatus Woesearchaeota archaeon]
MYSDKRGFVYTLDVFIAVAIIVAGSWILLFNLHSQADTTRPRIISDDIISESYSKRIIELNYPAIRNMSRNGTIVDTSKSFAEQVGEFYWLYIKSGDNKYLRYASTIIEEYYRGVIPAQYQYQVLIGDFNENITRTDAVYFRMTSLSAGGNLGTGQPHGHTCAIREDSLAVCWGHNNYRQLGRTITFSEPAHEAHPVDTTLRFRTISAGGEHTCGIDINSTLYCWGHNNYGQLGIGNTHNQDTPAFVGHNYIHVSAGHEHTCGITSDRRLYCWGSAANGRLGNGFSVGREETPVLIDAGQPYQTVSAGVDHTCALRPGGEAYCWGRNNNGQLGTGDNDDSSIPVRAGTMSFIMIDTGQYFSCGIEMTAERRVLCWGSNQNSRAGQSSPPNTILTPGYVQPAALNENIRTISVGGRHACAIATDNDAYCWGMNNQGRLGIGTPGGGDRTMTKTNLDGPYGLIAAGAAHTCAIRQDNLTMNCWGRNQEGQVGISGSGPRNSPVEMEPFDYDIISFELRELYTRSNTPKERSPVVVPSTAIIAGIDRDNQFYGPFLFQMVVWL